MNSIKFLDSPLRRRMSGQGLGSIFSRFVSPLFRSALKVAKPFAKKVGKQLLREGVGAATETLADIAEGVPPKQAMKNQARKRINKLASHTEKVLLSGPTKRKKQSGKGTVSKRKKSRKKRKLAHARFLD